MKRAVSISIGGSKRNKTVEMELCGEKVLIERIGTDGDMEKAARLYQELDGKVDAFGVGGADLGFQLENKYYPLYSAQKLVRYVQKTPVVDGQGLKNTLENRLGPFIIQRLGDYIKDRNAFIVSGADRWGFSKSILDAGFNVVFGDIMFGLGLPIPIRGEKNVKRAAALIMPIAGRLPFEWLYPTGEKQDKRVPKYEKYYQWASLIGGDCIYIMRHMPDRMDGKVIATNTTTPEDVEVFRQAGIRYLITSTPIIQGRTFGTNMMEAALIAVSGKGRKLSLEELDQMLDQLGFEPQLQEINK